jgi:hypothetical protein
MRRRLGIIAATLTLATGAVFSSVGSTEAASATPWWAPKGYHACKSDDDDNTCYWWAANRGNGRGSSYYVQPDGSYVYVTVNPCIKTEKP